MSSDSPINLRRDISVVRIPSGETVNMPAGTAVLITQALGGSYTVVIPTQPGLYRIANEDADAIGQEVIAPSVNSSSSGQVNADDVWAQLKTCYDPEIPVNIVDLGLIYSMEIKPEKQGAKVEVAMTLTAQGCGMGPAIANDAKQKILTIPGVVEADVQVVWDPPWTPDKISPEGRAKLGME